MLPLLHLHIAKQNPVIHSNFTKAKMEKNWKLWKLMDAYILRLGKKEHCTAWVSWIPWMLCAKICPESVCKRKILENWNPRNTKDESRKINWCLTFCFCDVSFFVCQKNDKGWEGLCILLEDGELQIWNDLQVQPSLTSTSADASARFNCDFSDANPSHVFWCIELAYVHKTTVFPIASHPWSLPKLWPLLYSFLPCSHAIMESLPGKSFCRNASF